jgi:serine-type D-Ala-D-Ala carboxypeptidase/endopeptidase
MRNKTFLLFILLLISSCKPHEKDNEKLKTEAVQISMKKNADSLLLDTKISSISIGIYKDGKKYTGHFGELDKGKAIKLY